MNVCFFDSITINIYFITSPHGFLISTEKYNSNDECRDALALYPWLVKKNIPCEKKYIGKSKKIFTLFYNSYIPGLAKTKKFSVKHQISFISMTINHFSYHKLSSESCRRRNKVCSIDNITKLRYKNSS